MKKLVLGITLLFSASLLFVSCDKDEVISQAELPSTAKSFIEANFEGTKVITVVQDDDDLYVWEYEVKLSNGIEITFNANGEWLEIEADKDTDRLPDHLIPDAILAYVTEHYPNQGVNSIEKESHGFDVELTNGVDLDFDHDGGFIRVDVD